MTIAELCLPALFVLAIGSVMPAKVMGRREFDNASPREPAFYKPGFRARSLGAQQNGLEAFPLFASAVLLAEMRAVPQGVVDGLALAFLLLRVIYVACYLGDRPAARSSVWAAGFIINLAIFFSPMLIGR